MNDPRFLLAAAAASVLSAYELEEPPAGSWMDGDGLVIPVNFPLVSALLLTLAALAGGLKTLLAAAYEPTSGARLSDATRKKLTDLGDRLPSLTITAGLLRIFAIFFAVLLMVGQLGGNPPQGSDWIGWSLTLLVAGLALEGVPALVLRGRAPGLVLWLLPVVRLLALPLSPLVILLSRILRGLGAPQESEAQPNLAEAMQKIARQGDRSVDLGHVEGRMIERIMRMPEMDAAAVMTPRTKIVAVEASSNLSQALELAREAGHSRLPVQEGDLDHLVGIFYVKDVLRQLSEGIPLEEHSTRDCKREAFFVPESMGAPELLEEMRKRRLHMAVVVDEYGGTAGVVTIEDLLEEIVGEIVDEHDREEEHEAIERVGPNEMLVDGGLSVGELNEALGTHLPLDADYDTVAGLICDGLGHIPNRGETFQQDGVALEVIEADDRRVHRVRVRRISAALESDAA